MGVYGVIDVKNAPTQEQIKEVKELWAKEINEAIESGNIEKVRLDLKGPLLGGIASRTAEQRRQALFKRFNLEPGGKDR